MKNSCIGRYGAWQALGILLAVCCLPWLAGAASAIGNATADGSLLVNRTRVWGNATLFNGSVIETAMAPSVLQLAGGTRVQLGAASRAIIYDRKLILEAGSGQVESAGAYLVEARTLQVATASEDSLARIRLDLAHKVTVAALRGQVRVANSAGVLVARLVAGDAVDFEPQTEGATLPTRASGCVLDTGGKVVMVDQTTNAILELEGENLRMEIGNRAAITGAARSAKPTVKGASMLVHVSDFKRLGKGGCKSAAAALQAATGSAAAVGAGVAAAGKGAAAGATAGASAAGGGMAGAGGAGAAAGAAATGAAISTTTVAVIGGVAAAATVGGMAAVGALPGQAESTPTASR